MGKLVINHDMVTVENARMLVGIFAVSAFRLLPALRYLLAGYTQIQNALPSLEIIEEGVITKDVAKVQSNVVSLYNSLEIRGLKFSYGDKTIELGSHKIDKGEYIEFKSGKRIPKWYSDGLTKTKTAEERRTWRSKTFPGFAKAIAEQWSKELTK